MTTSAPWHVQPTLVASSKPVVGESNFFKSCALCYDGSVALTTTENRTIELYKINGSSPNASSISNSELVSWKQFPQSENIVCAAWYPAAVPEDPSTFCFLASIKDCPVKLLDGSDGRLRASYRLVDHRERHIAPYCLSFNSIMSKIYCGFQNAIEVFDVNYPGEGSRILTTPNKKSKDGTKGIVSSLAFSPDYSGLYAAGTFSSTLVMYDENSPGESISHFGGVLGPITQVKFHPTEPHLLFATSRQTEKILCWDIRGDISAPILGFNRLGFTNQRIMFDMDDFGHLVSGDTNGVVSIFNYKNASPEIPQLQFQAHDDTVSAVALRRTEPVLISVSGSRHFNTNQDLSEDEETPSVGRVPISNDTSIKLWNVLSPSLQ